MASDDATTIRTPDTAIDETIELPALRYHEEALLGEGGIGRVMLAHDARVGRHVALKQLHDDAAGGMRARFLREACVQGQLEHPAIVPVYDLDRRPDGTLFFTMRRVRGRTLHEVLTALHEDDPVVRARYTQRELLTAFATVCLAIDYAHSRGVVHRDLKPSNIMFGDFGEVYVLDWGVARLVTDTAPAPPSDDGEPPARLSLTGQMMGTPLYMAPEQMGDPAVGAAADVFSLGAILFEILTLEQLRTAQTLYAPPEARPSVRTPERDVAPELETICVRATDADPAARYPSARELHAAVIKYLEGDRELEQRRQLAGEHAHAARQALARGDAEPDRTVAMRELTRALALDPTNAEHVVTLGQLLDLPPRTVPQSVRDEAAVNDQALVRLGARHAVLSCLLWFVFLPLVLAMGVVPGHGYQIALVLAPAALGAALSWVAQRRAYIPKWIQVTVIALMLLGGMGTSFMYGPFVLMPTLIATLAIVIQAHPDRAMRTTTMLLSVVAVCIPMVIELVRGAGAYVFGGGTITILPQALELPRGLTFALLIGTTATMTVVPSLFISRLRTTLSDLQLQQLLRAWHLRRLPEELIRSTHADLPRMQ